MYISQCLIAKNEEKNIGYCLEHLKSVVDEQIVVDTGSTDRTVEIAESLGAKVFHFEWINDFSAARNFALEKAKGDWIIFLDCDEYFSDSSVPLIKGCIREINGNRNIDGIFSELINIDKDKNVIGVVTNVSQRIFRKKRNIRYRKPIHEILADSKREEFKFMVVSVNKSDKLKIFHTGYDPGVIAEKNKNKRNILMLEKELEQNPTDSHLNLYISKSYYMETEYDEALKYALNALEFMDDSIELDFYPVIYSTILNSMFFAGRLHDEIKEMFENAVKKYPQYPDYYRIMGLAEMKVGNMQKAVELLEKCIDHCRNYKSIIESLALGQIDKVYTDLLNAYIAIDNRPKIVEISVALLHAEKYNFEILTVLIKTLLTSENEDSIMGFLKKLYDYNKFKDKIYLLKVSENCGNEKMTTYYRSILNAEEKEAYDVTVW